MLSPGLQAVLFGSTFYPGATVALDFLAQRYRAPGVGNFTGDFASLPGLTVTRASVGYAATSSGSLVLFPANTARITNLGLLVEEARTNVVLWNRDLTNAAWTKTNITAALDQVGADGVANAASSLTATGANGTALQAITLASSARFQSAYVKRITGSGTIQMTLDNGTTWTAITVTAAYTQLSVPTQTLANPTVGFRIVTSGDAIAVDFVQNENGTFATSPTPTTTASATRAADVVSLTGVTISTEGTAVASMLGSPNATGSSPRIIGGTSAALLFSANNALGTYNGTQTLTQAVVHVTGQRERSAVAWTAAGRTLSANGQAASTDANGIGTFTTLRLGSDNGAGQFYDSYIQVALIYPTAFSAAQLQAALQ